MLKIVVPIVASCDAERHAMLSVAGAVDWVRELGELVAANTGAVRLLYFDDDEIRAKVGKISVPAVTGPATLHVHDHLKMPGALPAVRHMLRTGDLQENDTVVLVNWRYSGIELGSLLRAAALLEGSPGAVAMSVQETRDSPVQYLLPRRILALDCLVFPDHDSMGKLPGGKLTRLSRPLFLHWQDLGLGPETKGAYAAIRDGGSPFTRMVRFPVDVSMGARAVQGVYLADGVNTGRKTLDKGRCDAVPAYAPDFLGPMRARLGDSGEVALNVPAMSDIPDATMLRVWPLTGCAVGHGKDFLLRSREAFETRLPFGDPLDGLLVALLDPNRQEAYDFYEPAHSTHGLWEVCPRTKKRLNAKTGEAIYNRQQFPSMLEASGVLAAGHPMDLLEHQADARVVPIVLDESQARRKWLEFEHCADTVASGGEISAMLAPWLRILNDAEVLESEILACGEEGGSSDANALGGRIESLMAELESYAWPIVQINRLVNHVFQTAPDRMTLYADIVVGVAMDRLAGLRGYIWSLCDKQRTVQAEAEIRSEASIPQRSRLRGTPVLPVDAQLPLRPWKIASDGESRLFVSAYDLETYDSGLFLVDIRSGGLIELPGHGIIYGGLWYDTARSVLFATHLLRGDRRASGLDVLNVDGELLERVEYVDDTTGSAFVAHSLTGSGGTLYFADATSKSVVGLDIETLRPAQRIRKDFISTPSAISMQGEVLTICARSENVVADVNPLTGEDALYANSATRLLYKAETYLADGLRYGFCYEYEPYSPDPQKHWLQTYDPEFRPRSRIFLGKQRSFDLHIVQGAGVLVLADYWRHLQFFDVKHGRHGQ